MALWARLLLHAQLHMLWILIIPVSAQRMHASDLASVVLMWKMLHRQSPTLPPRDLTMDANGQDHHFMFW